MVSKYFIKLYAVVHLSGYSRNGLVDEVVRLAHPKPHTHRLQTLVNHPADQGTEFRNHLPPQNYSHLHQLTAGHIQETRNCCGDLCTL